MKRDTGLLLYGLAGLALAPAATWLGQRAAYLAAQGLMAGVWLSACAHLLIYIPLGAYIAIYVALPARRALWPTPLLARLSGVLTLLSNALTVQIAAQGPELMALYRMDNFHVWKLLFGFFLVYVLWQAWRRRRAN